METPAMHTHPHSFAAPPPLAMSHMSAFPQTPSTALPTPLSADSTDRARAYKSRNKRPCDFCRYKKAACHLESQPPCELCIRYNKECTFVESPAKRRRPNDNADSDNGRSKSNGPHDFKHDRNSSISSAGHYTNGNFGHTGGYDIQQELLGWDHGIPAFHLPPVDMDNGLGGAPEFALDPAFYSDPTMAAFGGGFDPMANTTPNIQPMLHQKPPDLRPGSSVTSEPTPQSSISYAPPNLSLPFDLSSGEPSLDQQSSSNSTIVGLSGETDPYLLSRYRFDQYNEAKFQSIRIRKMSDGLGVDGHGIPTFFTIQHNALASKAQPQDKPETLDRYRREVEGMVSDEVGRRLIHLFYKYIQPYFPILSREGGSHNRDEDGCREPSSVPTCILAAIYGHALPFCAWDEKLCVEVYTPPSADALFKIAWASCMSSLHTPSYAGLQTLLLMVQRRPTNKNVSDTPFKGVMISAAVSIAQSLGLNRDPSDWPLPAWEIKQRRRLAWATFIQDKWLALNSGRPSYIHASDWIVSPLTPEDFPQQDRQPIDPSNPTTLTCHHFMNLCSLTILITDILTNLFSLRATASLHHSLEATLEVAKPLRLRLTSWHQALPPGLLCQQPPPHSSVTSPPQRRSSTTHELSAAGSLHLAYITAKISLFRAMLRPPLTTTTASAVSALRTGALAVAREVCDFLDSLHARELEAFWASYARTNFVIASSFLLLLFVTAPEVQDARECLDLLTRWRGLLRVKSRSCDLLCLALLRLDGVFVAGLERLVEVSEAAGEVWREEERGGVK